jgi:hypothetical protein
MLWHRDSRKFYLTAPYRVGRIEIPAGFGTDFASVPRALHWIVDRIGGHTEAAVVHDWLYWAQRTSRANADEIFYRLLRLSGCGRVKSLAMWAAVRSGGWLAWSRNEKEKRRLSEVRRGRADPKRPKR